MQTWKRTLAVLWIGVFLCNASYTMQAPFLPLYLLELGVRREAAELWAAVVLSSTYLVGALMSPFWGALADKYGTRKMIIRAGCSITIVYVLFMFVSNPWELLLVRILHGFSMGFVPSCLVILAAVAPKEETAWSLGMLQSGVIAGGLCGPMFGSLLTAWAGMKLSYLTGAVLMAMATVSIVLWVRADARPDRKGGQTAPGSALGIARHNPALLRMLLLIILFQMAIHMVQPLLSLFVETLVEDLRQATLASGFVFAASGIASIAAAPLWGRRARRKGESTVLTLCLLSVGVVMTLLSFAHALWTLIALQFLFGLFLAGIVPAINTVIVKHTEESIRGRAFGLMNSATQIGLMIGPPISGLLALALNHRSWIFGISGALLVGLGIWIGRQRNAVTAPAAYREA